MNELIPIPNFPGYLITREGRVLSRQPYNRWKKPGRISGYASVTLYKDGQRHDCYIHRLLLETFVGPCPPGMECRHLDDNKVNDSLGNLQWGTSFENKQDSVAHGTSSRKFTSEQVVEIRRRLAIGVTARELALRFRVDATTISNIKLKKVYVEV